jgi:hypothetical protein
VNPVIEEKESIMSESDNSARVNLFTSQLENEDTPANISSIYFGVD